MIYENILVQYGADEYMQKEAQERKQFLATVERLKLLRDTDPEAFDEMIEAMLYIRGEKQMNLYSINLFMEYGVDQTPVVNSLLEKQERLLAIVRSNKDIEHLDEAVKYMREIA